MQFTNIAKTLQAARENSGKKPEEIAELLGISIPAYHDLEAFDDELPSSLSLKQVAQLFNVLKVDPAEILDATWTGRPIDPYDFVNRIKSYLSNNRMTLKEFEDRVGWDINQLIDDPLSLLNYNIEGMVDISKELGIDAMEVLQGVIALR
jgi:hypothetical protein